MSRLADMVRPILWLALPIGLMTGGNALSAADPAAADPAPSFSHLLTSKTAETFASVQEFLKTAPENDREAAYLWLFQTAIDFGWEVQLVADAETYVQQADAVPLTAHFAEQVRLLGLAQGEEREQAVQQFQMFLRKLRLRSPNLGSDMAESLAMQLQLAGDRDAARAVYEKLSGAFFLNAEVKDWCERRMTRLDLVGKPSPGVAGTNMAGEPFDAAAWKGHVTLVDFWATDCRPCLEDLPKLREIYAEFHPLGLEIVGVSFDEDQVQLAEFIERQRLPWTILTNDKETPERFHVDFIPCLVLIDQNGHVVCTDAKVAHLRGALRRLLAGTR